MARRELGLERVRFHGLLDDDTSVSLSRGINSWLNLDSTVDFLIAQGMRSVIELSFMPSWLANKTTTSGMQYHPNNNPPSDFGAWGELIHAVASHLVDRYGIEEMSRWHFEVWNEPNINFWTGTQAQYFQLFAEAARAIKKVSPRLLVGGPATATGAGEGPYIEALRAFTTKEDVPLDFISSHVYSSTPFDHNINDVGEARERLQLIRNASGKMPLLITEFGSSYKNGAQNVTTATCHDTCEAASYLARAFSEVTAPGNSLNLSLLSYWALSDLQEEGGFPAINASFGGNFGLVNPWGVPKPAYRLMQLLNGMGSERLAVTLARPGAESVATSVGGDNGGRCLETVGALCGRNSTHVLILFYNQAPRARPIQACTVKPNVMSSFGSPGQPEEHATLWRIDDKNTNPKRAWEMLGAPQWPTAEQNKVIFRASIMVPTTVDLTSLAAAGIVIPPQGVAALTIRR
jgi:xylan 1,4-beta-xylosidase